MLTHYLIGSSDEVYTCSFLLSWNQEFTIIRITIAESKNYVSFSYEVLCFCFLGYILNDSMLVCQFLCTYNKQPQKCISQFWPVFLSICLSDLLISFHEISYYDFDLSFCPFVYQTCWSVFIKFHIMTLTCLSVHLSIRLADQFSWNLILWLWPVFLSICLSALLISFHEI